MDAYRVAGWLRGEDQRWWRSRPIEWLQRLYASLARLEASGLMRFQELPLVRLESGAHVPAFFAVFPPEDPGTGDFEKWRKRLPIVEPALAAPETKDVLKRLGVGEFDFRAAMGRLFGWAYDPQELRADPEANLEHFRILLELRRDGKLSDWDYAGLGRSIRLIDGEGRWARPEELYLPPELGGSAEAAGYVRSYVRAGPLCQPTIPPQGRPTQGLGAPAAAAGRKTAAIVRAAESRLPLLDGALAQGTLARFGPAARPGLSDTLPEGRGAGCGGGRRYRQPE